ncbi:MAG TPA: T9SS type A sorting domain-containing protein [Bacteroidales bacterium]|nr:T9SS type A sorting domain-containing protein [Bacteroidales bacterium]HRW96222.1 T9SS type A sorting domain-containing protein [Bacteroidales bacterium]
MFKMNFYKVFLSLPFFLLISLLLTGQNPRIYLRKTVGLDYPDFDEGGTDFALDDINADGCLDLLSVGDHGSPGFNSSQHGIIVWFGDCQGNFQNYMNGQFGYGGIAVGDVNNDGLKDAGYGVHHNYSTTSFGDQLIEVVLGDGTGMNWTVWDEGLATNGEDWGMFGTAFADFNSDGYLDLVSVSFACCAGLHVYLNQTDGTWMQSFGFLNGNSSMLVRSFDINKDGYMDFVSGHQSGTAYFGDGTGSFICNDDGLPGAGNTSRVAIDIAYLNPEAVTGISFVNASGGISVYSWNNQALLWEDISGNLPSSGTYQMTQLCDMNSDGFADAMAFGNRNFSLWLGDGDGDWIQDANFMTSGSPGIGQAMRTGGDFDNNGYPDLVILAQELSGGWIQFDKNFLYVYFESTVADSLWIKSVFPVGSETLIPGSVRFIEWRSAVQPNVASTVKIEISAFGPDGPWWLVADNLPNNGKYQWTVPNYGSVESFLRITVLTDDGSASTVTPQAFIIAGEPTANPVAQAYPKIMMMPNPGKDVVFLSNSHLAENMIVRNVAGVVVFTDDNPASLLNTSSWASGIYYWTIKRKDGSISTGKWLKY